MELTAKEREVIHAMRASERAHTAIYNYATKFEGDEQAFTVQELSQEYEDAYDE